ncbi:hypothetical protein OEZ86_003497 [Tetradesmus obliquus]|nr:hypothetical protein OEZ86_003497 [Tetradesmus obliquus]
MGPPCGCTRAQYGATLERLEHLTTSSVFDGQICAVKTIHNAQDELAFKIFKREAHIIQDCSHKRIVGFKALCRLTPKQAEHQGKWALVLEYAKGGTLMHKVSQSMISPGRQVYSNAQALAWALDVASALQYLHGRSPAVLHRDVKLSNVLLAKEEGAWVAKLSDFGLHVVVDGSRERLLRVSFDHNGSSQPRHFFTSSNSSRQACGALQAPYTPAATTQAAAHNRFSSSAASSSGGGAAGAQLTQQHLQALQQQLEQTPVQGSAAAAAAELPEAAATSDKDSAHQQAGGLAKQCDGGKAGAMLCSQPGRCVGPEHPGAALQQERPLRASSTPLLSSSSSWGVTLRDEREAAAVASAAQHLRGGAAPHAGPRRRASFQSCGLAGGELLSDDDYGSMGSMATGGTWDSEATYAPRSSDEAEEGWAEVESVFDMTGQTGSYMYMAPEVLLGQPYNEKADVFSFGVMLYELAARCLLLFSELPAHPSDPAVAERYAEKVSQGYRPSRPKRMPPGVWELVTECWQQQPAARPAMASVVDALTQLLAEEERGAGNCGGGGSRRNSLSLGINAAAAAASDTTVGSSKPAGKPGLAASASCSSAAAASGEQVGSSLPGEGAPACGCTIC